MEKFFKNIFPNWSKISIDYSWRGLIAMSQKLTPSIGKIENEEIYYGFGYHGVGVSSAPWTGKQLSKLVFSSNSKDLNISKIYKGLPKKFIFPKLRVFYFRLAVLFYIITESYQIIVFYLVQEVILLEATNQISIDQKLWKSFLKIFFQIGLKSQWIIVGEDLLLCRKN